MVSNVDEVLGNGMGMLSSDIQALEKSWKELTWVERNAAELCGYTQDSWDNVIQVPIDLLWWSEVPDRQRQALMTLGYTEASWNKYKGDSHFSHEPETTAPVLVGLSGSCSSFESSSSMAVAIANRVADIMNNTSDDLCELLIQAQPDQYED